MLNNNDVAMATLCDKCFHVLQLALQCKHQKINQAAVDLLQVIVHKLNFRNKVIYNGKSLSCTLIS